MHNAVGDAVRRVLKRYPAADPHDVESACWRAWDRKSDPAYVVRAGINAAIDGHRRVVTEEAYRTPDQVYVTPEDVIAVAELVTGSPVLRLLVEGYTQEEVAAELGTTRYRVREELTRIRGEL